MPPSPQFLSSKKKKGKQRKQRKSFRAETIKRLSLRSKCYYFSHSRASRIQKVFLSTNHGGRQFFSVFHGPSALKYISPTLQNAYFLKVIWCTILLPIIYYRIQDPFNMWCNISAFSFFLVCPQNLIITSSWTSLFLCSLLLNFFKVFHKKNNDSVILVTYQL